MTLKNTKSEPAQTAGNAPEPLTCQYCGMKTPMRIGLTLRGPFVCAKCFDNRGELQSKFTLDGRPIATITLPAASSQEAAPPMNDKARRIADYFGVPVAFDAEPAPSPATKETPPINDYHIVNPRSAESWRLENVELRKRMARALQAIEEILKVEVSNV